MAEERFADQFPIFSSRRRTRRGNDSEWHVAREQNSAKLELVMEVDRCCDALMNIGKQKTPSS